MIGSTIAVLIFTTLYGIATIHAPPALNAAVKVIRPDYEVFQEPYSENLAFSILQNDEQAQNLLAEVDFDFVYAVPLGSSEAGRWRDEGCWQESCAHVALFNYTAGGTIEAVVNMESQELLDIWSDPNARPGASPHTTHPALAIAAQDKEVQTVLGNIYDADLMMVPMNIWLLDDSCREDWCVDLTYHDPAGTGKIFHVTVNLQEKEVARTFYTRGRENRPYKDIPAQRNAYSDDCHKQYGWSICWEMTAHDGLNFYDANYQGTEIFSSAKVGQVEVWYPSWPGGYRDEIGFAASVPPYFGTVIEDFGDSFTVSQLFTEFTSWPNCICCYRYEQMMQFYADGTFEARFISHGPGCDDLSVYQPMWRIDVNLNGPENDEAWIWTGEEWAEAMTEQELDLFFNVSPDGSKLATFDGDTHYRWRYIPNDPLGLDEVKMFLVKYNSGEGEEPILTGPANTFEPPRQWLDEEAYSGENITVWYVPLMKTKKGGPWWCMPDPAPTMSPCEAVLRVEPDTDLPTAEELAATREAQQAAAADATPTPIPTMTSEPLPTTTPAPLEGTDPEALLLNLGCTACHVIGHLGEHNKVGPDLSNIGLVAENRVADQSAREYIRESILFPNNFIAPDCPNGPCLQNVMPQYYGERLTAIQLEAVIDYLLLQTAEAPATPIPIGQGSGSTQTEQDEIAANNNTQIPLSQRSIWVLFALPIVVMGLLFLFGQSKHKG